MTNNTVSGKHAQIEKTNTYMFLVIGIAASILSFTIVSSISLGRRLSYQSKVINTRTQAKKQINDNYGALQKLKTAYENFDSATESVIGTKDKNSKIVLDALPSKYDFPAVVSSMEKLVNITGGISSFGINGEDKEAVAEQSSINPKPVEIPLTISGSANYENVQKLVNNIQSSIRPFKINRIVLNGDQMNISFTITMVTYYMPAKNLEIPLEEVK